MKYLNRLRFFLVVIAFQAPISFADSYLEYSAGFTASRGLLSLGKVLNLNYFGLGISKELYAGSTGFFAGPNLSYERRFLFRNSPFVSVQYAPIYSSISATWNKREYAEGLNGGLVSASAGYQFEFKKFGAQIDISADTPVAEKFGKDWRLQWGLGLSFIGK